MKHRIIALLLLPALALAQQAGITLGYGPLPASNLPAISGDATSVAGTATVFAPNKQSAFVVCTTNQASLTGLPTCDGQTMGRAGIVLLAGQSTQSQNGFWSVPYPSGTWVRPGFYASGSTVLAQVDETTFIRAGTTYSGSLWKLATPTAGTITIDTTATTWTETQLALNATTIQAASAIPLALLASQPTVTIPCNPTSGGANLEPCTLAVNQLVFAGTILSLANPLVTPGPISAQSLSITGDGVHAGMAALLGNTTAPTLPANTAGFVAPNSASFTSYALQLPTSPPSGGQVLSCATPVSGISTCSWVSP